MVLIGFERAGCFGGGNAICSISTEGGGSMVVVSFMRMEFLFSLFEVCAIGAEGGMACGRGGCATEALYLEMLG